MEYQKAQTRDTKQFRKDLDEALSRLKNASNADRELRGSDDHPRSSRERLLSITKIQEAIMWLGMDLKAQREEGACDCENPYPESYNPDSPVIEPTADGIKL